MDTIDEIPIIWLKNRHADPYARVAAVDRLLPDGITEEARAFHMQLPGYQMTPLKRLTKLATRQGLGSTWVKDESARMGLNAFKALGSSFAIYRFICRKLDRTSMTFAEMMSDEVRAALGDITFTSATDGNHGKGLAWATRKLNFPCVIYVHRKTRQARIDAIAEYGAEVRVVDGNYDDAVRQCERDAEANDWQVISDTSWPGYEDVPTWVMQGYTTLLAEAQEQLAAQGIVKPTHVFLQAGVGAFAATVIAFYKKRFGPDAPTFIVVEPRKADCLYQSLKIDDGQPHAVSGELDTVMAGLACGEPSPLAWQIIKDCADFIVTVPDYVAAKGMRMYGVPLEGDPFVVSGESGAVTMGAVSFITRYSGASDIREALQLNPSSQVLLINTEGNTDPDYFRHVVWDGVLRVPREYRWH